MAASTLPPSLPPRAGPASAEVGLREGQLACDAAFALAKHCKQARRLAYFKGLLLQELAGAHADPALQGVLHELERKISEQQTAVVDSWSSKVKADPPVQSANSGFRERPNVISDRMLAQELGRLSHELDLALQRPPKRRQVSSAVQRPLTPPPGRPRAGISCQATVKSSKARSIRMHQYRAMSS